MLTAFQSPPFKLTLEDSSCDKCAMYGKNENSSSNATRTIGALHNLSFEPAGGYHVYSPLCLVLVVTHHW